jgi:hypothetical protein
MTSPGLALLIAAWMSPPEGTVVVHVTAETGAVMVKNRTAQKLNKVSAFMAEFSPFLIFLYLNSRFLVFTERISAPINLPDHLLSPFLERAFPGRAAPDRPRE